MPGQQRQAPPPDGPERPGDNPNTRNAQRRMNVRPKRTNQPAGQKDTSVMRLNWIDPLPQVDAIHPLGLEPNVDSIPAGIITLHPTLPSTIAQPFMDVVESTADRLFIDEDQKEQMKQHLHAQSYFKAARQLYSTMQDHEKAANQPLKAVYYDEEPIPLHMAGALGIVGHMDTKVGQVLIQDAGVQFKRWILEGTKIANPDLFNNIESHRAIWDDVESHRAVKRIAKERISELVKTPYTLEVAGVTHSVCMPPLDEENLPRYHESITNQVPHADELRMCVAAIESTPRQWQSGEALPHNADRTDITTALNLDYAGDLAPVRNLRELFEDFTALHVTTVRAKIQSIFKTGPPPAGSFGYGAQTVTSDRTKAQWTMPLSDADVNIGFLFSPNQSFVLSPRLVGYSRRQRETAMASFAAADGKAPI